MLEDLALELLDLVASFKERSILALCVLFMMQILFSILFLPTSPFVYFCGFAFGIYIGTITAFFFCLCSFLATYYLGTRISRYPYLRQKKIFSKSQEYLEGKVLATWPTVFALYVNPICPGGSMGYFFGLANTRAMPLLLKIMPVMSLKVLLEVSLASQVFQSVSEENIAESVFYATLILTMIVFPKFVFGNNLPSKKKNH